MTVTDIGSKTRRGRTTVPAVETPSASSALAELTGDAASPFVMIPVTQLRPHPANPRRDVGDLTELVDSIRAHGVRQNLLVVPLDDPEDPGLTYRIVIGHRRAAAAALAAVTHLPAAIDPNLTPTEQVELMLVENLQRSDLTAIEEADGYQGLLDLGLDEKAIAKATGRSRSTIAARLRLVPLPDKVREAVHEHVLTLDQANAVGDLPEADRRAVVKAVGTVNFAAELAKAGKAAERARQCAPLLAALDGVGAKELKKNDYSTPDGSTRLGSVNFGWTTDEAIAESTAEILPGIVPGCSWRWHYDTIYVYRPHTLEEAAQAAALAEERSAADAARAAQDEAIAAERAVLEDFAGLTNTTREQFLREQLARKLPLAASTAILEFAGTYLAAKPWVNLFADAADVASWLGTPLPDGAEAMQTWQLGQVLAEPVITTAAKMAPTNRLLAALAAVMEPISSRRWEMVAEARLLPLTAHWYALLETLGYPVSDAERAALTTKSDDVDDDASAAAQA